MSAGLDKLCRTMADHLNSQGVEAVTAWTMSPRQERKGPVVVVSLRGCQAGPSGLQNYLGESFDQETGLWQERYGRRAKLTFGLDIYAPEKGDEEMVQTAFDALAGALLLGGPEELRVEEFSCGQTVYEPESRRLKRPVQAVCGAYLCVAAQSVGGPIDIELRGVVKG